MKSIHACIILLLVLLTVSCQPSPANTAPIPPQGITPPPTPDPKIPGIENHYTTSSGLRIDEFLLQKMPDPDSIDIRLANEAEMPLYMFHQPERENEKKSPYNFTENQVNGDISMLWQGKTLSLRYTLDKNSGNNAIEVYQGQEKIQTIPAGQASPIPPVWGFWGKDDQWFLEISEVASKSSSESNATVLETTGVLYINGVNQNERLGYEEIFGFQIIGDQPFYFFKQGNKINIACGDKIIETNYDSIPHYGCCSAGALNPLQRFNMVSFFAVRNHLNYLVEIGLY